MPNKLISIFSGSSGLNTKVDPGRIVFNPETGISALAACVDCEIDDSGRIERRRGFTATARTESWHSLYSCGSYAVGVTGDALCIIEPDMSYLPIRNVHGGARMSMIRDTDGAQGVIYYCNGYENGRIMSKVSHSWPVGSYVGPETIKTFYPAPMGHLLEIRNSRMFIAEGNFLWYSEPCSYSLFRLASDFFGFQSRLRMVQAVAGGIWLSDSEAIYFLGGNIAPTGLEMPTQTKQADCPAIEGTATKVPASRIGLDGLAGIVVVFATTEGVCVGTADGQLINLTERKIDFPGGLSGAGLYRDGKYTVTIK